MFRKTLITFIGAAICAALLTACAGGGSIDTKKLEEMKNKMEQQSEEDKPGEEKKASKAEEEGGEEEAPDGEFAKAFKEQGAENNGGLFVKVGSKVYFRVYDKRSLALTTMGKPYPSEVDELPSKLMYYDLETDETKELCEVCGFGGLFASADGLLLADPKRQATTLIREDGSIEEDYLEGYPNDEAPEGNVSLSKGNYGDLVAHTSDGGDVVVYENYIYEPDENQMFMDNIEGAVCFSDDSVFLIKASGDRSPEEGKWAYDLTGLSYECLRFDEKHKTEYGTKISCLAQIYSSGWSAGEVDHDDLVGTWDLAGANVEGFQYDDKSKDPIRTRLTFDEDVFARIYTVDGDTGEKLGDETVFEIAAQDPETDYAFYLVDINDDNKEDPGSLAICYLSGNRLGVFRRYHYDGNSTGWYKGSFYKVND